MSSEADIKMDSVIGKMLRIGVSTAAVVVLIGLVVYLTGAHGPSPDYRHFHGTPIVPAQFGSILRSAAQLNSRSILEVGILLLVATPIARVVFCIVAFESQR